MTVRVPTLQMLAIVAILLFAASLMLSACGGDDEPKDDVPTPAAVPSKDRPQPTVAPTVVRATPTAAPTTARMSLDEYTKICSGLSLDGAIEEEEDFTYRDISELFGEYIELFESVEPPAEFAVWHRAVLAYQRAVKKATDDYPAPEDEEVSDEFLLEVLFPAGLEHQAAIDAAVRGMVPDVRDRLVAADCIEGEVTEAVSVTELTVGKTEEAVLDKPGQAARFSFLAQQGERYLIEVVKGTVPDFALNMPFSETHRVVDFVFAEGRQTLSVTWVAPNSDTYFVQVWADSEDGTGSFTITVRIDPRPDRPSNVQYAWEESAIRVTWDAVDGAAYYKIYYDDFFPEGCGVDEDGKPRFCEELASRVDGTSFVHTSPETEKNYYWVVACNNEGCSDFRNEAAPPQEARPAAPTNVRHAMEGSAIRLSWDEVDGASFYKIFHFFVAVCDLRLVGRSGFCEELAANIVGTTHLHASPDTRPNLYYWVAACNKGGCSEIDRSNPPVAIEDRSTRATRAPTVTPKPTAVPAPTPAPAPTVSPAPTATAVPGTAATVVPTPEPTAAPEPTDADRPQTPTNVRYALEGSTIEVSWGAVDGANYYKVYHDDFFDSSCKLSRDGSPSFCDELAANVVETSYVHAQPSGSGNYYWLVACNQAGCSGVDSNNPASPIEARPGSPTNVLYAREGSTIRVTWDAVDGANYYKVYHDDFFDSSCKLSRDGSPSFCEELAANVMETTYIHTEPDEDENYYWVIACNRGGCSDVDSENPAREAE